VLTRLKLLALLLVVPAVAYGVATVVRGQMNAELRSAIVREVPNADRAMVAAATVDAYCAGGGATNNPGICATNGRLGFMARAASWTAGVTLVLLALIWGAGRWARTNRSLLLHVFRPGLYVTIGVLVCLTIANAALAIAAIYVGESALIERVHVGIIFAVAAGAVLGIMGMIGSLTSVVQAATTRVLGQAVSRDEAPELWRSVDASASTLGALPPDNIVLGLDTNFFVTEATVECESGQLEGRTPYCSLPLGRILTPGEFDAIVGHELGHFKGEDTKFSSHFYPIYRGTALSLQALQEVGLHGARAIPLLPAIATLSYFYESFAVAESHLSRDREIAADAAGASITTPATLGSALVKVHAFADTWSGTIEAAIEALEQGSSCRNASTAFAGHVKEEANPAALQGLDDQQLAHPTDSHPPLSVRLAALGLDLAAVSEASLDITPAATALDRVPAVERLEERLSHAYQVLLARRLDLREPATPAAAGA
jgi:Zn-dependent protease with chaperone function